MLQVLDGFIFQLCSKKKIQLAQNSHQPKEITANWVGPQLLSSDNSLVKTIEDEPGYKEANEAPEQAPRDERHCGAVMCWSCLLLIFNILFFNLVQ